MRPVADALTPLLESAPLTHPVVPIMANVDGHPLAIAADVRAELTNHIFSPVQWVRAVETMRDAGITDYLEIGPGNVLSGLIKRTYREAQTQTSDALLASSSSAMSAVHRPKAYSRKPPYHYVPKHLTADDILRIRR